MVVVVVVVVGEEVVGVSQNGAGERVEAASCIFGLLSWLCALQQRKQRQKRFLLVRRARARAHFLTTHAGKLWGWAVMS